MGAKNSIPPIGGEDVSIVNIGKTALSKNMEENNFDYEEIEEPKLVFSFTYFGKRISIEEENLTPEQIKKVVEIINETHS